MGAVNSKSTDEVSPALNGQVLDVVYRDERDGLHTLKDLGNIRRSALFFSKVDFPAQVLRSRLNRSLHRIRLADGNQLDAVLTFDAQTVSEPRELLAAIWMVEEQRWDEAAEVLQLASQCDCCTLPLSLTADDINKHWSKTAYMSLPRVLAQLRVVGRHVRFRDGSCLRFLRRANGEVRAIKDEPGFRLDVNPPLAAHHLYQRHRQQHDPPVRSGIYYNGRRWVSSFGITDASVSSVSSFAKGMIYDHFCWTHPINRTSIHLNSYSGARVLELVLTDSSHNFVAGIRLGDVADRSVLVFVFTTEAPVCASGAFKDRFRQTTQLGSEALGRGLEVVFDGQVVQDEPSEWEVDDSDDDEDGGGESEAEGDDGDDDDDGDVDGGDDGDDDDDMHPNDGQEASGGSDEYSELLGREGLWSAHTGNKDRGS
ncbi:unnamed protein product [Vitrella brassicaformis CCMP3155]|uniref:Uncharacterized protein n=1 Tax=Vitrella brassicaformis (strain CCMP3155) TaxID=1169540 RepID=A0A0G4G6Q3_VITBC|nr:unnamed protein product [Vitrella brassicaformis CCMP3155]|eukprot:CEM24048.1 unnamed protein product [Vitrella brassicaformis CCMP3155]